MPYRINDPAEWRPIHSAPRDGRLVLLRGGHDSYLCNVETELASLAQADKPGLWLNDEWVVAFENSGWDAIVRFEPTHWAPLTECDDKPA